ncbi:polysaccharide biosynthesis C-terminal domain-containing protein [Reichenbachiella sp. MALMAid0571]|uniref:lipopolysaccharide biosynthesis protein n=1 Tax=Reichenbachiella sp. MALMAid0571 TaxID=3143939 RepID=UPI0032DEE3C9
MSQLRKLAGETVWYGLSSIIGRVISFFLTPLYTSFFLPGEYGVVTELFAYSAFFNVIYMYGMETAYFRFATKNKKNNQEYFNLCVSSIIATSFLISASLVLLASPIMSVLGYEGQEEIIYWIAAILVIDSIYALPFAKLRLEGKAKRFAFIRLANVLVAVSLNLFFLVFCDGVINGRFLGGFKDVVSIFYAPDFNVKYVFLSNLLANGLFIILLSPQFKAFRFTFNYTKFKPLLIYGFPIMVIGIAGTTNEMLSRTLLKYILPEGFYPGQTNLDALGVFGACYKLSVFMMLGTQAFRYAAEPFFFSKASQSDSPQLFSNVMKGFIIFNCVVFLGVTVNLEPLSVMFLRNPEYREGLYIVPFLLMGYLFLGIYYNLSVWFKVTDKTKYGAMITGLGTVITVVANLLLIPILGYFGSALTTLVTYSFMAGLSYYLGQKHYPIPYRVSNAVFYLLIASVLSYISYHIDFNSLFLNIIVRNISIIFFLIIIYLSEHDNLKGRIIFGIKLP